MQDSLPLGRKLPRLPCGCGQAGCLDAIGSARGIERLHAHLHGRAMRAEAIVADWQAEDAEACETVAVWLEVIMIFLIPAPEKVRLAHKVLTASLAA